MRSLFPGASHAEPAVNPTGAHWFTRSTLQFTNLPPPLKVATPVAGAQRHRY
jgi:hypothetical protein